MATAVRNIRDRLPGRDTARRRLRLRLVGRPVWCGLVLALLSPSLALASTGQAPGPASACSAQSDTQGTSTLGSQIVFMRDYDIYAMNPDGTNLRNLTNAFASCGVLSTDPALSASGRRIAFVRNESPSPGIADSDVFVMNADGTNVVRLTVGQNDYEPAWSPDGTRLAYSFATDPTNAANNQGSSIYVLSATGIGAHKVASGNAEMPQWSPDGTKILFEANRTGSTCDLFTVHVDGTHEQQLTHSTGCNIDPRWSPDGKQILFESDQNCSPYCYRQVWDMNADGTNQRQLTTVTPAAASYGLSWSPDGSKIVFGNVYGSGDPSLYVMNADGSNISQLTHPPACDLGFCGDATPNWGPQSP